MKRIGNEYKKPLPWYANKKGNPLFENFPFLMLSSQVKLLTQAKFFDDGTIAFDVAVFQVVEQRTAFTYQHSQSSFSAIIFSVELQVLSQVGNTVGKQCYLRLG